MTILSTLRRAVRQVFGHRFLDITEDLPHRVALRYGRTSTSFDRTTSRIEKNGKLVAMLSLIDRIELHQPSNQEGPPNWYVTVHISGGRQIEVGQVTDEMDASIVAARISKVTGRPVVVR